ncbi:unnamed protein product [Rhizopus stolonifer]
MTRIMFTHPMFISLPSPPISHHRSTVIMDDNAELRPFLMNKKENIEYYLPPIQHVLTPTSSPSASEEEDFTPIRKTSIASLLNSEPPLKRGRPKQTGICKKRRNDHTFLPRATKGLRHFSKQVCDKVAEQQTTTYNQVADALAEDIEKSTNSTTNNTSNNIRRRVYDALNVLMAMNIISKDKKEIRWLGIPECYSKTRNQEELVKEIQREKRRQEEMMSSLRLLEGVVKDKMAKHLHIRNIIWRNQHQSVDEQSKIAFPFFIIQCPDARDIQSNPHSAVISFVDHNPHGIIEDTEVLQYLNTCM